MTVTSVHPVSPDRVLLEHDYSLHTPHQILGPYFPALERPVATNDLTTTPGIEGNAQGEIIVVEGRVLN